MRAMNLANSLINAGHNVVIWSSGFFHQEKRHRVNQYEVIKINDKLTINLIPSTGYKKNISIGRLFDHALLSINLKRQLYAFDGEKPSLAFIGYPPVEMAYVAGSWCQKNSIPFVLDVKDQWPEIFTRIFPRRLAWIAEIMFYPYFYMGRSIGKKANIISSMTPEFLKWYQNFCRKKNDIGDFVFPLASIITRSSHSELELADRFLSENNLSHGNSKTVVFFVGNFMHTAFNFDPIINAATKAQANNKDWVFLLCGDGEAWNAVRSKTIHLPNIIMPGRINQSQIERIASISKIAIAPIKNNPDYLMSVPNKIVDYFSVGLPVLTSLNGVVERIIEEFNVGAVYDDLKVDSLYSNLSNLLDGDNIVLNKMSQNSLQLYKSQFDGNQVYSNAVLRLETLAHSLAIRHER
jgi:glycosyltransferase involved in cell wall biosynthesis